MLWRLLALSAILTQLCSGYRISGLVRNTLFCWGDVFVDACEGDKKMIVLAKEVKERREKQRNKREREEGGRRVE